MSLLTGYSNANKVIISGKTRRITSSPLGDPTISITEQAGGTIKVESVQWYKVIQVATASYQYVGMTLTAAESCAEAMRQKFTRDKNIWEYKAVVESGKVKFRWVSETTGKVLDSEISIQNQGGGMYSVVVNASCTDESFSTTPSSYTPSWPSCFDDVN